MNKAIYPGSFDPITFGHLDIIERCSKLYDKLIVGINEIDNKKEFMFNALEREEMIKDSVSHLENVEVRIFNNLLVDFAKKENSKIIIRGLRVLSDFEYEFKMALMNRNLNNQITTLFMMPHEKYTHISSSLLKEVFCLGGDISNYVPQLIIDKLAKKHNG